VPGTICLSFWNNVSIQLIRLPQFDAVHGFTYDYMHSAFLGVSKSLMKWWLESQYHEQPFYIGRQVKRINENLMDFRVPYCYDRTIRCIELRKNWKASEWRTWTFISPVVLKNILPVVYLEHLNKFVEAIMILSSSCIHVSEVERSNKLLHEFKAGIEALYGPEFCSDNCHIILHAAA